MARDIIVIGASAGGVEAVSRVVADLPTDLRAAVFVVIHIPADSTSVLPKILSRAGALPAVHAEEGMTIEHGRVYVAPPGHHLIVGSGHVHVTRGPKENGHRPAVDPLFRSAARAYAERVVGVVLSGSLDDGTAGLQVVRALGGEALVQDPEEAMYPGMPGSALENAEGARALPLAEIGPVLVALAGRGGGRDPEPGTRAVETMSQEEREPDATRPDPGELGTIRDQSSGLSCPECSGSLWVEPEGDILQFRCRVGHAYTVEALVSAQSQAVEAALWSALNALEEKADLARRMVRRLGRAATSVRRFVEQAEEATAQARVLRALLVDSYGLNPPAASGDTGGPPAERESA